MTRQTIGGRSLKLLILIAGLLSLRGEVRAQDAWDMAERNIVRLPSDSFPEVPPPVRREMGRLGCLVPQGSDLDRPHNVVAGHFASPDQMDWAFLCSTGGKSAIHVAWGGVERCVAPASEIPDRNFLQELGGGRIGFSRRLISAGGDRVARHAGADAASVVGDRPHNGIEDYFEGKASTILYCVNGKWLQLNGVD